MKKLLILSVVLSTSLLLSGCMAEDADMYEPQQEDYIKGGYTADGKDYGTVTATASGIIENEIYNSRNSNTSTFSIDVDTASYSIFRKYVSNNQLPPFESIRTEEMVNYFDYEYDQPVGETPFSIGTVLADCPWNSNNKLLMIGIQGKDIVYEEAPSNNLVFLVDVSGSMRSQSKLNMVKESLALLVENLREEDYLSIVTYAGTAEIVLQPTPGDQTQTILNVLNSLEAGGGTNGAGGIELAYDLAYQNFDFEGNNRVILSTDGDFNIGTTTSQGLIEIVKEKAEIGIYLTILGFGQNHSAVYLMEELSNDGQGTYHFIDTLQEADKVLNHEISSTIVPIADDVKVQIEFNEDVVESYRLIGYENRTLSNDEFDDDSVDAGDMGAGHNVTAFYEITLSTNQYLPTDKVSTISVRYKNVGEDDSILIEGIVRANDYEESPNNDFLFAASVVEISLLMRDSSYKGNSNFNDAISRIENSLGTDPYNLREEFYQLAQSLNALMDVNTQ